ncbi:MAG: hypothetical protein R2941_12350 [Desulfobacterales bacterium]
MANDKSIFVNLSFEKTHLPPFTDVLILGKDCPLGMNGVSQCLDLLVPDGFERFEVEDEHVAAVIINKSILKRLSPAKVIEILGRRVFPYVGNDEIVKVDIVTRIVYEPFPWKSEMPYESKTSDTPVLSGDSSSSGNGLHPGATAPARIPCGDGRQCVSGDTDPEDIVQSPYNLVLDCLHEKPAVDARQDIDDVLELMKQQQKTVLPVFEDGNFSGVIRRVDIIDYLIEYRGELETAIEERTGELRKINALLVSEIEERRKAEAEREILRDQFYHAQRIQTIGTLAGKVAHEFNNYLTIILGNTELALCDPDVPGDTAGHLNMVHQATLRAI